jgi:CRP/FNR family transcriptional regulator, cyclic AMP receptor protein
MNQHGTVPAQRFWGLLDGAEQERLSALGSAKVFPPGATICVEGDPATHVFVLLAGLVKVLSVTKDGHEIVLALRGNGDIVGELAGETTGQRNATMEAVDTVHALIVKYDRFSSFLDSYPGAARAYRHAVTRRWSDTATILRNFSMTSGAQRVARLLLDLATQYGSGKNGEIDVPLTQEELASLAGTSRATVTRAFSSWRGRGFIRTGPRRITITNPDSLKRIADKHQ